MKVVRRLGINIELDRVDSDPVVLIIYSLPSLLQIPMFGLALTFWVMMFTCITTHQQRATAAKLDTPVVTMAE